MPWQRPAQRLLLFEFVRAGSFGVQGIDPAESSGGLQRGRALL